MEYGQVPEGAHGGGGQGPRRSRRPNLGQPPEFYGDWAAEEELPSFLTSTHRTTTGVAMQRTTLVTPQKVERTPEVEDDARSKVSVASSRSRVELDEEFATLERSIRQKLDRLSELRAEMSRAAQQNEAKMDDLERYADFEDEDDQEDGKEQDAHGVKPFSGELSAIAPAGAHYMPTPQSTRIPIWKNREEGSTAPPQAPPSKPSTGWRVSEQGRKQREQRKPESKAYYNWEEPASYGFPPEAPSSKPLTGWRDKWQEAEDEWQGAASHGHQPPPPSSPPSATTKASKVPQNQPESGLADALANALITALKSQNVTTEKFVARQGEGSKLPSFSGNPLDWPIFAHQYRQSTKDCGFTPAQNMSRLEKALKGEARRHVRALMIVPDNADVVLERLEQRYGRAEYVVQALIETAKKTPTPKADKLSTIMDYAGAISNLVTTVKTLHVPAHLENPQLMQELVDKLPDNLKLQWGMHTLLQKRVNLLDLASWIDKVAEAASKVTIPKLRIRDGKEENVNVAATEESTQSKQSKTCPVCKLEGHAVSSCEIFKKKNVQQRWEAIRASNLCFCCLRGGHSVKVCRSKWTCRVEGCGKKHNTLLHGGPGPKKDDKVSADDAKLLEKLSQLNTNVNIMKGPGALLRIITVHLKEPGGTIIANALIDGGSTCTLICAQLAKKLSLSGPVDPIRIKWTNQQKQTDSGSRKVEVWISPLEEKVEYKLKNVRTISDLQLTRQRDDLDKICKKWAHLQEIKMRYLPGERPLILIGQPHTFLTVAREVKESGMDAPMMSRCMLGWAIHGPTEGTGEEESMFSCVHESDEDILHDLVKESFSLDSIGVKPMVSTRSRDDIAAEALMKQVTRRVGDHWETGLLWKREPVVLPPSHDVALSRFRGIERKLRRDELLRGQYGAKIKDYLAKGYARKLSQEELATPTDRQWFLPHFNTAHPNKPGKIRIVFDASSKANGVSLNDFLLTGPDLLNSLPGILLKFRQRRIALSGDIAEMFHQAKIRSADCPAQRFLWKENPEDPEPSVYQLEVMMFGSVCSPYCAQYIKNRNAEEFQHEFPAAAAAIVQNHYMDDYLDSLDTEDEAVSLALEVKEVHQIGGFSIGKWISNSQTFLEALGAGSGQVTKDLAEWSEIPTERALGLHWVPAEDCFTFRVNLERAGKGIATGEDVPTKRAVLRLVMLIWDPLGFLGHYMIKARILLQDLWRYKIGWDDEIPSTSFTKWKAWVRELPKLAEVKLHRCYSWKASTSHHNQVHIFCDSSEKAGCCVAYLRVQDEDGNAEVSIIMSKTKVAPLKPVSIPRLELIAALLASRLGKFIKEQLDIPIHQIVYWTDSMTVLKWVRSEARRFQVFVAARVGEIHENSDIRQWRWVPTKDNPADDGTREGKADLSSSSRWWNGPSFLKQPEKEWPQEPNFEDEQDEELELRKEFVGVTVELPGQSLPEVSRFSNYLRLVRATAYVLKIIEWMLAKRKSISRVLALQRAEMMLIRRSQWEAYPNEMAMLSKEEEIPKSSSLYSLSPVLDHLGVLRMKSRLATATDMDLRMPVILHPKEGLTTLLIQYYHRLCLHQGEDTMRNEIRQRYWIPRLRSAVRQVIRSCTLCKLRKAKAQPPMMGAIPDFRIQPQPRPFTITGMDYFGPMEVTVGRYHEKRYGVIFTCLSTRAVHLEVAQSLTTDSCIMAIRRFIARRGEPKQIHSDNGTNLRGADKELREALEEMDQAKITDELSVKAIEWHFIPPSAAHMGGSWERLVRSVKIAMSVILKARAPKEEVLQTVFAEAEATINSRPLTDVPVDPESPEALTPFHFLIGTSSISQPPGEFKMDLNLRKQWRQAQALADSFWQRWKREYVPTLQRRHKWHGKVPPVSVGDLVIVFDESLKRNNWPLGIVTHVYPGKDKVVRIVDVKTASGIYKRPVVKLGKLDLKSAESPG